MKVTLRKFLDIVGTNFIETYITCLYVYEWDELFEKWFPKQLLQGFNSIEELEPYMDYEIVSFRQWLNYGQVDQQDIYVREIEELF